MMTYLFVRSIVNHDWWWPYVMFCFQLVYDYFLREN